MAFLKIMILVFTMINPDQTKASTCKLGNESLQICDGVPTYIRCDNFVFSLTARYRHHEIEQTYY